MTEKSNPRQIVLDTNFLLIPAQFGVDIFSEIDRVCAFRHKIAVMEGTLKELEHLAAMGTAPEKREARLAQGLVRSYRPKVIPMEGMDVDAALLELPPEEAIVATQDQALKRKLMERGIPLLVLRKEKQLELIGQ